MERVTRINKDYHHSLTIKCNLSLDLATAKGYEPIVVKFTSDSRNDTGYEIQYEPTQSVYVDSKTYAIRDGMDKTIVENIVDILNTLFDNSLNFDKIREIISPLVKECLQKCESRYGNSVADFKEVGYDSKLILY